jgi:hypothetical protein
LVAALTKHILQYLNIKYCILILSLFITSCGMSNQYVYKLYPGPVQPDSKVVTLEFGSGIYEVTIDGMKVKRSDYKVIKLKPGEHVIQWEATFLVSVLIDADGIAHDATTNTVQMKAGHTYTLHKDRTTGYGYETYLWMTDETTGETVAGEKMP